MADPSGELPWEFEATRRARRARVLHRVLRRAVLVLLVAVAIPAVLLGTGFWTLHGEEARDRALPTRAPPSLPASTTTNKEDVPRCRSHLTPDDPLRVWIGGDSLAGSLGPALGERLAKTGVALPTFDSRPSSGLSNASFFNWPKHAADEMQRVDPELVVFIIGANDSSFVRSRPVDERGQPLWRGYYATLVQQMLDIFRAGGRPVYWIGSPPLRDHGKDDGVRQLNEVAKAVVGLNENAAYVDAYKLFSDSHGEYTPTLPGPQGEPVRVRTSDGIHFTPLGADLLAGKVYQQIDARCHLAEQAVPGRRQPVREAPGSSQRPPTSAPSRPRPATTSPPTTAPPPPPSTTTTPPTTAITLPV